MKLRPGADWTLQLAALAHDIERAIPERKVSRTHFTDFNEFKKAHALNSAKITGEILERYKIDQPVKKRVKFLIEHHEFGFDNDPDVTVLKDADSLSFFEINLPLYSRRHDQKEVLFRMRWGYQRLSPTARDTLKYLKYDDEKLNRLLRQLLAES